MAHGLLFTGREDFNMKRWNVLGLIGFLITSVGLFVTFRADSLATRWQPLGNGAWGGTTNVALRQTYHEVGLIVLCFGLTALAMAAWTWVTESRKASSHSSSHLQGVSRPE